MGGFGYSDEESRRLYDECASGNYRELKDLLMRRAFRLAYGNEEARARYLSEECCQNALLRIWQRIDRCRKPDRFVIWCLTILHNEYCTLLEREGLLARSREWGPVGSSGRGRPRRIRPAEVESLDAPIGKESGVTLGETIADPERVEDPLAWRLACQSILEAICRSTAISEMSRRVLRGWLEGLTDRELAEICDRRTGSIAGIRHHDLIRLRERDSELIDCLRGLPGDAM